MILVLLGTFPTQFKRPLIEIESLCKEGAISEQVIVQNGYTTMNSVYMEFRPFLSLPQLNELYQSARVIISHAGTGSLVKGLKLYKKIIAIPRLAKYGEVVDDHQVEILEEFAIKNYILPWRESGQLKALLSSLEGFTPAHYCSDKHKIINFLTTYIDSL